MSKNWDSWVWIKWKANAPKDAWKKWEGNKNVKGAWSTMGEWDCMLWLNAEDADALENFVWNDLRNNEWVADTKSNWAKQWWSSAA